MHPISLQTPYMQNTAYKIRHNHINRSSMYVAKQEPGWCRVWGWNLGQNAEMMMSQDKHGVGNRPRNAEMKCLGGSEKKIIWESRTGVPSPAWPCPGTEHYANHGKGGALADENSYICYHHSLTQKIYLLPRSILYIVFYFFPFITCIVF